MSDERPSALRMHRALASPVRNRLLELLEREPDLDAPTLADRLALHVNTVRSHLGVLEEAGLVTPVPEARDRPGRPRLLYRVVPAGERPDADDDGAYRFLAEVLASYLDATSDDAAQAAERAGHAWGGFSIAEPPPFEALSTTGAFDRLVEMLDEMGFDPALEPVTDGARQRLALRRCPFLSVAKAHPDVVCSVHLGLMRGAIDRLGADVEVEDLVPWARPDACVSTVVAGSGDGPGAVCSASAR